MRKIKTEYSVFIFLWFLLSGCQQEKVASDEDLAAQVIQVKYLNRITINGQNYKPTDQSIFTTFSVARSGSSRTEITVKCSYKLVSPTGLVTDSFEQTAPLTKQSNVISFTNATDTSKIEGICSKYELVVGFTKKQNGANTTIFVATTQ